MVRRCRSRMRPDQPIPPFDPTPVTVTEPPHLYNWASTAHGPIDEGGQLGACNKRLRAYCGNATISANGQFVVGRCFRV